MTEITGSAKEIIAFLLAHINDPVKWVLKVHKGKRSPDSNAYFHVLCDKLRQALGISMARCKNHLIADYGQIEYISEGEPAYYKTNAPDDFMMEQEEPHTKCIKVAEENGRKVYFYRLYRGSHTYNTAEMARLIDGTISECQQQGIETATPDELARMAANWEKNYARQNKEMCNNTGGQENG